MKLHLKTASIHKRYFKKLFGSLPIDKAMVQLFLESVQQYLKEDGVQSSVLGNVSKLPKEWNPEHVRAADILRFLRGWTDRAHAIRATDNDISAFAHNIAWDQRTKLAINTEYSNLRFRVVWQALNSAAVNDWSFAKQVAENSRKLISGSTCYHNIAKAVFFLVDGDLKKAASIASKKDTGSAKFYLETQSIAFTRALCGMIVAAAENDPLRVAHGLKLALVNVRDQFECALQAQGVAALLRRLNPGLMEEFDGTGLDAWDEELWKWTASNSVSFAKLNLKPLSHELHDVLVDLEHPQWLDFKASANSKTDVKNVAPPDGIPLSYWTELGKRHRSAIVEYLKEKERLEHFLRYRKLSNKHQPQHAPDWVPGSVIQWIRGDYASTRVRNLNDAAWFEKPLRSQTKFWAIHQMNELVAIFPDPVGDKDLFEIRRFKTSAEAIQFSKEAIQKHRDNGFVPMRKQDLSPDKVAKGQVVRSTSRDSEDPNERAVSELFQALGVPKLQAQRAARKAARDFENDEEDSIIKSMQEKARKREEWSKAQKEKQKAINRQTAALERELKRATQAKSSSRKSNAGSATSKSPDKAATTRKAKSTEKVPRRFELKEGTSNKFWTVRVVKDAVVTHWVRLGSAGQTTTKSYENNEKAQSEMDKLIREKIGKGYKEIN